MFYKLMDGNVVVDVLHEARYVRYLPRSQRWVNTDEYSANGIMSSNGSTIYHLIGRTCSCQQNLIKVRVEKIEEVEYTALLSQLSASKAEGAALRQEIDALRAQLNEQNYLLQQILAKL